MYRNIKTKLMSDNQKDPVFDFRMDLSSWITILFMILAFAFMFIPATTMESTGNILNLAYGIVATFFLIAIACIPVIIYCWFAKVIPDIDYSVIVAAILTTIAMIGLLLN